MANYELIITYPIRLTEAEVRFGAHGVIPKALQRECLQALVWLDEGVAAGVRQMQQQATRRRKRLSHKRTTR